MTLFNFLTSAFGKIEGLDPDLSAIKWDLGMEN